MSYNSRMSRAELQKQHEEELAKFQAEVDTRVDAIMDTCSVNPHAMTLFCQNPAILAVCRKQLELPETMTDKAAYEYIRRRLIDGKTVTPKQNGVMPKLSDLVQKKFGDSLSHTAEGNGWRPPVHHLEVVNGHLTGRGFMETESDKDFATYTWMSQSEYLRFWDGKVANGVSGSWHAVYAIKITYPDGYVVEYVRDKNRRELKCSTVWTDNETIGIRMYSSVYVFRRLIDLLRDRFGNGIIQNLGDMMFNSFAGRASREYSEFLIPHSLLPVKRDKKQDSWRFLKLDGEWTSPEDKKETLYINNANLINMKEECSQYGQSGRTEIYRWFNNESFYTKVFNWLASLALDCAEEDVEKNLDMRIQYLVRPY